MHPYLQQGKPIRLGSITTSEIELRDIIKAWLAISLAFGILLKSSGISFYMAVIISSFTVGVGFLLHELGHKLVAQKYGCFAEFRSFDQMLLLAIVMSFFGFVFAAPGAVMIAGPVGVRRNGKISAAGPLVNLILAPLFLLVMYLSSSGLWTVIGFYGFMINSWLALFNMIPFGNFDGIKILRWNKWVYGLMVAVSLAFMMLQGFVRTLVGG